MNNFPKMRRIVAVFVAFCIILNCFTAVFSVAESEETITEAAYNEAKDVILTAAQNMEEKADLSSLDIPASYAKELYMDTLFNNPSLIYITSAFTSANVSINADGEIDSIKIPYVKAQYNLSGRVSAVKNRAEEIIDSIIDSGMSEAEKHLIILEYLCGNVSKSSDNVIVSVYDSTAYGPLVDGKGDSLGYALAYKLLADTAGLDSFIAFGIENNDIYWNAVEIGGYYFYVDSFEADGENKVTVPGTDTKISIVDHFMFMSNESSFAVLGHPQGTNYCYGAPIKVGGASKLPFSQFWTGIESPMVYCDGSWYCISGTSDKVILKRSPEKNYVGVNESAFYTNSNAIGSISSDGKLIYFTNLDAELHTIEPNGENVTVVYDAYGHNKRVGDLYFDGDSVESVLYTDTNILDSNNSYLEGTTAPEKTITYGDLNGDKKINDTDYNIICEYIKNGTAIDSTYINYADIDRNGIIDVYDRVYIARFITGDALIADLFFR